MNDGSQMLSTKISNMDVGRKYSQVLKNVIQFQTIYFYMSVVAAFFYISSPLLMNQVDLPFGTFDTNNVYLHHLAMAMQWIAISQAAFYCTSGTTIIYCGLCVNIIIQYKILKQNLLDLDYEDQNQLMSCLIKTVKHHIFLRKYVKKFSRPSNDFYDF